MAATVISVVIRLDCGSLLPLSRSQPAVSNVFKLVRPPEPLIRHQAAITNAAAGRSNPGRTLTFRWR
jgi:hypothetical protein